MTRDEGDELRVQREEEIINRLIGIEERRVMLKEKRATSEAELRAQGAAELKMAIEESKVMIDVLGVLDRKIA